MITTPEEARAELKRLGFQDIFERIAQGDIPRVLISSIAPVKIFYKLMPDLVEELPVSENYLPLWEWNLQAVVAYDQKRDIFVRYYYGDRSDKTLGTTYQQFLTAVLLELVESGKGGRSWRNWRGSLSTSIWTSSALSLNRATTKIMKQQTAVL
jgi:hypothetical protein